MADEVEVSEIIKTSSDGNVKISVEKYNELLEKIADQKGSISKLNELLNKARNEPPVIHRTVVNKTPEILAQEHVVSGATCMVLGAALFAVGAWRFKVGSSKLS